MRGITLLEIIIVFGVLAIVATVLVGALVEFRSTSAVVGAKSEIIGMLRDARARTLASRNNTNYGLHFEETQAVLFEGNTYSALAPSNEIYRLYTARIAAIVLGGVSDVVFERLSGAASVNGTIVLSATRDSSKTETITIFPTGLVE
ncbi:MAG TPA: type II secretion system protein [Candidatus Paceibacterota bacterium]